MEPGTGFYSGSRLLQPLGDQIGLSIDQVNYVSCQLVSILLAIPFRMLFHPSKVSPTTRHLFEAVAGLCLVGFCFGPQLIHVIGQTLLCYLALLIAPAHCHKLSFVITLGYLSMLHIYRQIYDYGGYTLDITGPMMISTQKLSDLAFCVHDGMVKEEEKLTESQKKYALKSQPSLIELMGYIFSFHNVMLGPTMFFTDYMDFITGKNIGMAEPSYKQTGRYMDPKSTTIILKKVLVCIVTVTLFLKVSSLMPTSSYFRDPEFLQSSFWYQTTYMLISLSMVRNRYYFAWTLGELTNVVAGFGFTGYKEDGSENWDMINNANIWGVELCTSMKVNVDSWNIRTLIWLRRIVYDRAPMYNTLLTFAVSAFWHGFYPGYYIAFFTGTLFIFANRKIRRAVRPFFQTSKPLAFLYDVITFTFTRFCCVYMVAPFVVYEFMPTIQFFKAQYFWLHIGAIASILFLPNRPSSRAKTE